AFLCRLRPPPTSTLFPYTTLFRSMEIFLSSSTTNSTASSMPRFSDIGLAPAVTDFRPSRKIACARTVAVVVPSPAISEVLVGHRSEEHTSELQSRFDLVCRLLLEK